jgi:hypothetical protein
MSTFLRKIALAAFASLLIGACIPALAAAAGPVVTPANGSDILLPDGSVYQLNDDGSYSWIPDVATADAMGLDWSALQFVGSLSGPVGNQIPSVAPAAKAPAAPAAPSLAQANGNDVLLPDGSVYQRNDDGSYSWIPDVATANAMGLDWNNLRAVDSLDGPVANPFPAAVRAR